MQTSTHETTSPRRQRNARTKDDTTQASFSKGLFFGKVLSERVFPYPETDESEKDVLQMTADAIQKMGRDLDIPRIEKEKRIPPEFLAKFKEMGLFGLIVPEEYGGFGMSTAGYVQMFAELSTVDGSIGTTIGAHQSIGLKALLMFGTEEQKKKYLPLLASGEMIAAFALTEPEAGSDAGSIRTTATLSEDGKFWTLNGSKIWITNGGIATFYTVFAKTRHPERPAGKQDAITAFIVTRGMEGFTNGIEENKLGMRGSSTTALSFDNVRVPNENVLGEPGKGFKIAMGVLNNGRIGLGGACALGSRTLIQRAVDHATQRHQFGKPLSDFGLIQSKLANMMIETYAAEAMVRVTTNLMDEGEADYSVEGAICKVFNSEACWRTVNECLQIAGGTGYMVEYGYERVLRDSRILMIWEGANEVLRLFIGLSGLQGPGEQLKEVSRALRQPMENVLGSIGILSDFGVRWIQRRVGSTDRVVGVHPLLAIEGEVFESYVGQLAESTEIALRKHGKQIIDNQFAIKRLAEITIDLFALACTLSRASAAVEKKGESGAAQDLRLARAFCRKARRRMAENLRRLNKNDDELEKQIAKNLCQTGLPRNGLFQ